jgi:hypothetical protein
MHPMTVGVRLPLWSGIGKLGPSVTWRPLSPVRIGEMADGDGEEVRGERPLLGGEPHILALADRAGGPQLGKRRDQRGDLGVGMDR